MAASGTIGGVVTFTVKVSGSPIPDELRILSIRIGKRINRVSSAKLMILDGNSGTGKFDASSSSIFVPGAQISIEAGYDSNNSVLFKGIVTGQAIHIDESNGSALEVECRDEAIRMIVGRKCLTYSKQKDSDIISSIIGTYSGLSADVTATTTVWPEQVQYYVTDWDYILSAADANSMVVTTDGGKVSVFKPGANTAPVFAMKYGDGLMECNAELNSITQLGNVTANAWDYKTQAVISTSSSASLAGAGNLSSKKLSEVIGLDNYMLQSNAPIETADLTNWTEAQVTKSEYAKIRGDVKFQGTAIVAPGKYITLQGLGDRFNGDHLMSGITHNISDGNWLTDVSIGLSPTWFIEEPDVIAPAASGLLPGASGLYSGTVKQMYEDPGSQFRILVTVPVFDKNGAGIWARLANFYSTSGAGVFFLPEVGDEVVVGFMNEDPRFPVILGSLYSSSKVKPFEGLAPNQKNSIKAIVSKSGISIQFDDDKKILTIETPAKNTMIISDDAKQITIKDQHSNSIIMSADGITIKSPKNINIEADQNVNIKGTQGITVQSSGGDVATKGINIKETADMQYSAEGAQMAKVTSGMQLTLKSAMVMIN
ncbi:type VI secretion system tip protein VgrG [Mucilaginibacter sp. L196]|uniref:type VI secretion system tip protein VgrG n=1 Tax=Mucilaginibacter sp. L196 TaxID=1641870 RepID=UPI00131E14CE|nr:type VI secretion system tip protein VgrG [Mucilaginibacter sp. L196]